MMSSMRNAVQRRNHKERAQPAERSRWGLLEKHKDYALRAKDYNAKKARLKILRSKAAERNPDEFYYGMLSSKSKGGRKIADRGNPVLSQDAVKLLKTQDSGYLRTIIQKTRRQIERLEEEFILKPGEEGIEADTLVPGARMGRKMVFVEDVGSQRRLSGLGQSGKIDDRMEVEEEEDEDENEDEDGSLSQRPKSGKQLEREKQARKYDTLCRKRHKKEQEARRAKLVALKTREKDLRDAERGLELQRAKMNNTVGGLNKAGVKFRIRERKK